MEKLTDKNLLVFNFIVSFKCTHDGNSPGGREIMSATGVSSTSVVAFHLRKLERLGLIVWEPRLARSIRVVGAEWRPPTAPGGNGNHTHNPNPTKAE